MANRSRYATLAEQLDAHVGPRLREEIMQGCDEVAASASQPKQARWMKAVMDRMDALVDEPTRTRVMEQCGWRCAWKGRAEKIRAIRARSRSMDGFYAGLENLFSPGVATEREGNTIFLSYPECYCGMVKAAREPVSVTYCHCGRGYFLAMFETALGRPVAVDLLQSVITGAAACRFAVHIPPDEFGAGDGAEG